MPPSTTSWTSSSAGSTRSRPRSRSGASKERLAATFRDRRRRASPRGAEGARGRPCRRALSGLFVGRFGAGKTALQELDLAIVVGFVLGDVEPLRIVVGAPTALRVHQGQPLVVTLPKLGERPVARFVEDVQVMVEILALDGLARRLAEVHGDVPLLLDVVGPAS